MGWIGEQGFITPGDHIFQNLWHNIWVGKIRYATNLEECGTLVVFYPTHTIWSPIPCGLPSLVATETGGSTGTDATLTLIVRTDKLERGH